MIDIFTSRLKEGLKEIKNLQKGKAKLPGIEELMKELKA